MSIRSFCLVFLVSAILALPGAVTAQVIGTFSWQTQPYCNVVTVQVVQQGPLYQLVGTDDLCGAGTAPVTGTAVPAGGSVIFGMTAALPSGRPAHVSATISLATVSGTWSDADGHSGAFAFGAATGGSPRPAPASAAAITANQFAPTVYAGTGAATTVARSDHDHDARYYTKAQSDAQSVETVTTTGIYQSFTYVAEGVTALGESFTTTRAGHLLITKLAAGIGVTCTGASDSRLVFLRVDGVAMRTSAVYAVTPSIGTLRMVGVTDGVVPAGAHTVDIAAECLSTSTTLGVGYTSISNAGIVVLP